MGNVVELEDGHVDLGSRQVLRGEREPTQLTTNEAEVLRFLVAHTGHVVSRTELLRSVWGYRVDIETRAVDLTMYRLRKKIERTPNAPRHIITVRHVGYRFHPSNALGTPSDDDDLRTGWIVVSRIPGRGERWTDDPIEMVSALEIHDALARDLMGAQEPAVELVDDAFRLLFREREGAIAWAVGMQQRATLPLAMAVHHGPVVVRDHPITGRPLWTGAALERCVDLCRRADSGEIWFTNTSAKGVEQAIRIDVDGWCWRIGEPSVPAPPQSNFNTPTVGREEDLATVLAALTKGPLRVCGPPGVGKTRVVLALPDSVYLDLDGVSSEYTLRCRLAAALGLSTQVVSAEQLTRVIAERGSPCLVLDHAEQLRPCAAEEVARMAGGTPRTMWVWVSRSVSRGPPWPTHAIDPLPAETAAYILDPAPREVHRKIAAQLDGLPLALELVRQRLKNMAPDPVLRQLDNHFRLLSGSAGRRGGLRATLEEALAALSTSSHKVIEQLGVFAGPFSPDAAMSVVETEHYVPDVLQDLVEGGLLQRERLHTPEGLEEDRYRLLRSIRSLVWDRLDEDRQRVLRQSHRQTYTRLAEALLIQDRDYELRNLMRGEAAEFEAALTDADRSVTGVLSLATEQLLGASRPPAERKAWLDAAVDGAPSSRVRAQALLARSAYHRGRDPDAALRDASDCAALDTPLAPLAHRARALALDAAGDRNGALEALKTSLDLAQDPRHHALVLLSWGVLHVDLGGIVEAEAAIRRSLELSIRHRDIEAQCSAHAYLGMLVRKLDRFDESEAHLIEALALARVHGWTISVASLHGNLGNNAWARGRWEDALSFQRQGSEWWRRSGVMDSREAQSRVNCGNALARLGRLSEAEQHYQDVITDTRDLDLSVPKATSHRGMAWLEEQRGNPLGAVSHCERALAELPGDGLLQREFRLLRITNLAAAGQRQRARSLLDSEPETTGPDEAILIDLTRAHLESERTATTVAAARQHLARRRLVSSNTRVVGESHTGFLEYSDVSISPADIEIHIERLEAASDRQDTTR